MGYYVYGNGKLVFGKDRYDEAYDALVQLNELDELKRGGSYSTAGNGDPLRRQTRWFSWMDADYPSKCPTTTAILEEVGFVVTRLDADQYNRAYGHGKVDENGRFLRGRVNDEFVDLEPGDELIELEYDNKTGQEEYFLLALEPFVKFGEIEWHGEDGDRWKFTFRDGRMWHVTSRIVFDEPVVYDPPACWPTREDTL